MTLNVVHWSLRALEIHFQTETALQDTECEAPYTAFFLALVDTKWRAVQCSAVVCIIARQQY